MGCGVNIYEFKLMLGWPIKRKNICIWGLKLVVKLYVSYKLHYISASPYSKINLPSPKKK